MSEDKNCDLLFEYLRSILYDSQIQTLDVVKLDEPYQKLGLGLQFLERAVREMKTYSEALSRGNLSVKTPPRDNFLCENLKNIHANLNHLTWQAKQVAKGDYSQSVSYLGEFSEAFNTMTRQLQEREESFRERLLTEAYLDPLTGIGNRYFLTEQMTELLKNNKPLIFCYCDLDHLKYINDHFRHVEGDRYICHFVKTVKNFIRKEDIFARVGGDEFCLVMEDWTAAQAKERITYMQTAFEHVETKPYPKGFSFGVIEIPTDHKDLCVNDIIEQADHIMYQQKAQHRHIYTKQLSDE